MDEHRRSASAREWRLQSRDEDASEHEEDGDTLPTDTSKEEYFENIPSSSSSEDDQTPHRDGQRTSIQYGQIVGNDFARIHAGDVLNHIGANINYYINNTPILERGRYARLLYSAASDFESSVVGSDRGSVASTSMSSLGGVRAGEEIAVSFSFLIKNASEVYKLHMTALRDDMPLLIDYDLEEKDPEVINKFRFKPSRYDNHDWMVVNEDLGTKKFIAYGPVISGFDLKIDIELHNGWTWSGQRQRCRCFREDGIATRARSREYTIATSQQIVASGEAGRFYEETLFVKRCSCWKPTVYAEDGSGMVDATTSLSKTAIGSLT